MLLSTAYFSAFQLSCQTKAALYKQSLTRSLSNAKCSILKSSSNTLNTFFIDQVYRSVISQLYIHAYVNNAALQTFTVWWNVFCFIYSCAHKFTCPLQKMQNVNFNKIRGIMKIACYCLFKTVLNKLFHTTDVYIFSTRQNWIHKNVPVQKFTYPWILILCVTSWMIPDCLSVLWWVPCWSEPPPPALNALCCLLEHQ